MHKLDLLIVLLAGFANISIALLVYLKNKQHLTNKIFLFLIGSLVGWMFANYLSVSLDDTDKVFIAVKFVLATVVLQTTFFYLFVSAFPGNHLTISQKHKKIYLTLSALIFLIGLYPGFFSGYELKGDSISPQPSPLIVLFMLHTGFSVIGGSFRLWNRFKKSVGMERTQFKYLMIASAVILVISPLTNFMLPVVFDFYFFTPFGPVYTFIFASIIGYSMARHRLFDFRTVVAKALAYLFSIGLAGTIYVLTVFTLSTIFLSKEEVSIKILIFYAFLAILLSFNFGFIKQFFDKVTNRIFYKDAYEPQEFLDKLNNSIVSNIEIGILLRHSTAVIEENLKSSFCQIIVPETDSTELKVSGTRDEKYTAEEIKTIDQWMSANGSRIIKYEDLDDSAIDVKNIFDKYDISLLSHLTTSLYGTQQTIAYIIFGAKKSGNIYSNADIRIIDIISDELVIAIQNALRFEEIQDFNVTLQKEVNDATSKLRKTNEKLKTLDETKDEFISMASHQLRTPLTSVKGYLSMVLEGDAGEINDNQKKLLDQAFVSSQRMVYLIADLLNVSRLRTGKFIIDAQPSNLADVVEGEISQLVEQAKAKAQTLTYDKPTDFPILMLDETKIRQVIMNFADNALYYTPSGGKVKIELTTDKNHIYFAVKDNGMGVPKEEQKHMFTKFYRAKNARSARPDGTGLGLFMAKKVITAQGGNILFESTEGKGSTFGFSFNKKHLATPDKDQPAEGATEQTSQAQ